LSVRAAVVPWQAPEESAFLSTPSPLLELYDLDLHVRKPLIIESQQSCCPGADVKDTLAR
jgi:hypothetical protein